jgi:hypothetical protein
MARPPDAEARRQARSSAYESLAVSIAVLLVGWGLLVYAAISIPVLAAIAGPPVLLLPAVRAFTILQSFRLKDLLLYLSPFIGVFALNLFGFEFEHHSIPILLGSVMAPALLPLIVVHVAAFRRLRS